MIALYKPNILRKEASIDQFFNDLFYTGWRGYSENNHPQVSSDDSNITLTFELPGFQKSDVQIDITHDQLRVSAKSTNTALTRQHLQYTSAIPPIEFKSSSATLENGILTITLKKAADAKTKQPKVS
jgi:HSP20 family molecular chaperone IbpA